MISLGFGVPIETASKMFGYTDVKTTQIYAMITDRKLSDEGIMAQKVCARKIENYFILITTRYKLIF